MRLTQSVVDPPVRPAVTGESFFFNWSGQSVSQLVRVGAGKEQGDTEREKERGRERERERERE